MQEFKKVDKKGGVIGALTGLLASLCCITPIVLIFLGLGSVSFAFSFIKLKPYFLLTSTLLLGIAFFIHFRQRKCGIRAGIKSPFVLTALTVHLVLFVGSLYFLLPIVSPYVFEKRLFSTRDTPLHPPSCHLQLEIVSKSFNALTCVSCEASLKYSLEKNSGVYAAEVDLSNSQTLVHYNKEEVSSREILEAVPVDFEVKNKVDLCS
ncbi:MAG: cation transporter [Patescibacteria group bacterium]|nr:cation transporter [Patescibacteria group bacterium]